MWLLVTAAWIGSVAGSVSLMRNLHRPRMALLVGLLPAIAPVASAWAMAPFTITGDGDAIGWAFVLSLAVAQTAVIVLAARALRRRLPDMTGVFD